MIFFKENIKQVKPATKAALVDLLKKGRVLVLPTDTIYGFSCLATKPAAIKEIYRLKQKISHKPLILLVASLAMLKRYTFVSPAQEKLLKKIWLKKRPTTIILKGRGLLPAIAENKNFGLACRLPKQKLLIKILKTIDQPLVSTSVNLSGQAPLADPQQIQQFFKETKNQPAAVLDVGRNRHQKPSRLLDLRDPQNVIVIRD